MHDLGNDAGDDDVFDVLAGDVGIIEKISDHEAVLVTGAAHLRRQTIGAFQLIAFIHTYGNVGISDIKYK